MRTLPPADPGEPDTRSATRYLLWVAAKQSRTIVGGVAFGVAWMVAQALLPATVGRAIDRGVAARSLAGLATWALVMLGLGVVIAVTGVMRHRFAVQNWLTSAYRTVQLTGRQATRLGATLPRRLAAGEVVAIGTSDVAHIGNAMDITARGAGAVVAIIVIAVILLVTSLPLGLVVLVGVPLLMALVAPLLGPLHRRQQAQRDLVGALTGRANDIVAGLRVLRGIGGEEAFADRYQAESQRVRRSGVQVGRVQSMLEAAQYLIPGVFLVLVTWLGARFALAGSITAGQLVAFYGYAAFLVTPLRTLTEAADKITRAHVSARRIVRVLALRPDVADTGTTDLPAAGDLADAASGLVVRPGRLTAIAAADPVDAQRIADRLGRYADGDVTLGGVALAEVPLATVRSRILVADNDARLFSGRLRDELDPTGDAGDAAVTAALHAASATDIVEALPAGLDEQVDERGRSFSGGQQQRLRLARALLADPEVLILVEPTSAVDAHTEARIGARLAEARAGRTTVVATTSPLMLDHAWVAYVEDGKVVAEGGHRELLATEPRYAATVTRGEDE